MIALLPNLSSSRRRPGPTVARHALNRLHRADAPVLGAVLNQIDLEKADNYYGEYSGYGNRYYRKYGYYVNPRA